MADVFSKRKRSEIMSKVKSSDTNLEKKLKPFMKVLGFTHQPKNIFGKPDFANKKEKIAVFVDGCFWHKCSKHYEFPETNQEFWKKKINKNSERDNKVTRRLKKEGWRVLRVWEHDLKKLK